jgi:hypothetical protein
MVELNAPIVGEINFAPRPQPRRGLVIALPIQRADLPALSLILLAGALLGGWFWVTNQPQGVFALGDPTVAAWDPLVLTLLRQKPITLTLTLALTCLILAAALAVSPLRWWAYLRFVAKTGLAAQLKQFQRRVPEADEAEAWVAAQVAWQQELQATVEQAAAAEAQAAAPNAAAALPTAPDASATAQAGGQPVATDAPQPAAAGAAPATGTQPAGDQPSAPPAANPPAADAAPAPGPLPAAQQTAEQQAAAQQAAGQQAAPGQQPAASDPAQPKAILPNNQQASAEMAALAQETKDEELDLTELTDVQDLLSSFSDNDVISAELLALSASLDDVDLVALVQQCHTVAAELATSIRMPE